MLRFVPSKTQWATWSLPSKLTCIGTYLGLLSIVLTILFFAWGLASGKPILEVTYWLDQLNPPIAAEKYVQNAAKEGKVDANAIKSLSKLVSSRDLLHLIIRNNSADKIEDVDLQLDAFDIADVALHSNSSKIMAERERLAAFEISDNFIARFPNLTSIPPKAEIAMIVWGDFNTFLLRGPVKVFSTAKAVTVVRQGTTLGLRLFVARYLSWLVALLAVGLLLAGLKRFS